MKLFIRNKNKIIHIIGLIDMNLLIIIMITTLNIGKIDSLKMKWIHSEGKTAKGDDIGVSLMNEQITTKAMLTPQKWFFNVMTSKPTVKYIKEAEEDGLKYQIELLKGKLETKYNDLIRDLYDQKLLNTERKLKNRLSIVKEKPMKLDINVKPIKSLYYYNPETMEFTQ